MALEPHKAAWLLTLDEDVKRVLPQLKESARHLLLAHAALESGWGQAKAWRHGFNFGNITAGPSWQGAKWTDVGGDEDAAGNKITQVWRAYSTIDAAIKDYWDFLGPNQNRGRYLHARDFLANGAVLDFAAELHKARYYELDPRKYAKFLAGVLQTVIRELLPTRLTP